MLRIYMNEHIKERDPSDPVIAVVDAKRGKVNQLVYTNEVELVDGQGFTIARIKYNSKGFPGAPHKAKAWVEVYSHDNVRVIA